MTPKSLIILCTTAIIYVLLAALAVLSPHGDSYALTNNDDTQNVVEDTQNSDAVVNKDKFLLLKNDDGVEIKLTLEQLETFTNSEVIFELDGEQVSFQAVSLKTVILWSGLKSDVDLVVALDSKGAGVAYRSVDLEKENNAFIIYSNPDGSELDSEYGEFCLYLASGNHAGMMLDLDVIDFG